MVLDEIFFKDTIVVQLESTEKDELFEELVEVVHSHCPNIDRDVVLSNLNEREAKMTTGIMHNVAIPHALIQRVKGSVGAIGISKKGIDYDSLDKAPVHIVFMIIGNSDEVEHHIQILKSLAQVLQLPNIVKSFLKCTNASEVYDLLCSSEQRVSN